jgi:quercetin dioxygenase-like cupin family protein
MAVVHRFIGKENAFDWEDVHAKKYDDGAAKGASGKILIGRDEGAEHFVFRYFLIQPGGHSATRDHHAHVHGVMILHGKARVTVEDQVYDLNPRDLIFIKPWEHHDLAAIGDEPMGFLCVIPNKDMLSKLDESQTK